MDITPSYNPLSSKDKIQQDNSELNPGQNIGGFTVNSGSLSQEKMTLDGANQKIKIGNASAPLTGKGIFIGNDGAASMGYDFRAGDPAGNYIHWDESAGTLTIVGAISSTTGAIGGFLVGADYIRDVADSFGLASTVTGGDDVRFYAGSTFANRATAPFRVTESGVIVAPGYVAIAKGTFGGDGSDGALTVSSGVTTIDLGGTRYAVKNYTTISITGTGSIQFINPHANGTYIVVKCQGDCTLTSSATLGIDGTLAGATAGAAVTNTAATDGNTGTDGTTYLITSHKGVKATSAAIGLGGAIGSFDFSTLDARMQKYNMAYVGAGGGSGSVTGNGGAAATSGVGGIGGGALIMEVAGALDFGASFTISCAGQDGGNATNTNVYESGGGGGGGGGGFFLGLYVTLTTNAGTISVAGGIGGKINANGSSANAYGGGGGGSGETAGDDGTILNSNSAVQNGGDGGDGKSFGWIPNTDW